MKKQLLNLRIVVLMSLLLFTGKKGIVGQTMVEPVQNSSTAEN